MTKEEYKKTAIRMMDSVRKNQKYIGEFSCRGVECDDCPLKNHCGKASKLEEAHPIVEIVEEWGKKHPIVTNADKYREVFGVSPTTIEVGSFVCPERVGFSGICKATNSCTDCKIDFWTAEYKAPKEEDK